METRCMPPRDTKALIRSSLATLLRDLLMHFRHIQFTGFLDQITKTALRKCPGLTEDNHLFPEDHQRRYGADLKMPGNLLLILRVDLGKYDIWMLFRNLVVGRCK